MLEFGFPVGYMGNQPPDTKATNHSSATNFPQHVDKFIRTELEHQAIMGPFEHSPFSPWYRTNPLMTRPKRDSQDRRVILDLSYPEGASVNAQIPSQSLLNATFKLRLPTPKQLADRIMTLGPGCHLFKIDLSRAYRQVCVFYYVTVMDIDIIKLIISQFSKRVRLCGILGFRFTKHCYGF